MNQKEIEDSILLRTGRGTIGLRAIIEMVTRNFDESSKFSAQPELQLRCLDIIKDLLDQRRLFAGTVSRDRLKFFYWFGSPNEIVGRIKTEWDTSSQCDLPFDSQNEIVSLTSIEPRLQPGPFF